MKHPAKIKRLQKLLEKAVNPATKAWFDNYLPRAIEYRGRKLREIAKNV